MTEHQRAFFERAAGALQTARRNLDAGDANASVNRAYRACFYAATAALLGDAERSVAAVRGAVG
ncbi:HEPN domain-containing protein [Rubrivirga sp.]|uniref:HEPN domain-containing protein n=1 Tax=Rubrivirga sp. TaxID=1885344 RepID=UPI003B521946